MNPVETLSLSSEVFASSHQISCDIANEAVLLSMESGEYYGLNPVGASIWKLIQQPRSVRAIRDALLIEYAAVTEAECERQVMTFLSEMIALELVDVR